MASHWFFELSQRINVEMDREMARVGSGSCLQSGYGIEQVALEYAQHVGTMQGLAKALQIAEDMEKGKAPD